MSHAYYRVPSMDGSTRTFPVPFGYLSRAHVKVYVGGDEVLNASLEFPTEGTVLLPAGLPYAGQPLVIRRETPGKPLVGYAYGGLDFRDLNTSVRQLQYLAEEAEDQANMGLAPDTDGLIDAGGTRLKNLADPVSSTDAATRNWVLSLGTTTLLSLASLSQAAIINKVGYRIDIQDYTLDGGGLVSAVAASLAKGTGLVSLMGGRVLGVSTPVVLPKQTGIDGGAMPSLRYNNLGIGATVDQRTARGAITLLSGGYLDVTASGSFLKRLTLLPHGLDLSKSTGSATDRLNLKSAFAGTAVKGTESNDVRMKEMLIAGFDLGINIQHTYGGRLRMDDVSIDCTSGVKITGGADIDRITNVHCWPFLTYGDGTPEVISRDGVAFFFGVGDSEAGSFDDWFQAINCFAYGYKTAFELYKASNVQLIGCQCDGTLPRDAAFYLHGWAHQCRLIDCYSYAGGYTVGLRVDAVPFPGGHPSWVSVEGGIIGGAGNAIQLLQGGLSIGGKPTLITGSTASAGVPNPGNAIYVGPNAGSLVADLGICECAAILYVDPAWQGDVIDITLPAFGGGGFVNVYNEGELSTAQRNRIIIRGSNPLHGASVDKMVRPLKLSGTFGGELQLENLAAGSAAQLKHSILAGVDGSLTFRGIDPTNNAAFPMMVLYRDANGTPKSPYFPIPTYSDAAAAGNAGVPVNGLWCSPDGIVRKR